jgi:hypothetical protein
MDSAFMPDPQSRAIASLIERVKKLEEKLDDREPKGEKG